MILSELRLKDVRIFFNFPPKVDVHSKIVIIFLWLIIASRKHWLLEEQHPGVQTENVDGFINRHGPFQSSLNEGKHKRCKKPSLLRGIGHMFRFGKHRKDGIAPVNDTIAIDEHNTSIHSKHANKENKSTTLPNGSSSIINRKPPNYQPPPPVAVGIPIASNGIHHNDVFNHRYSHYVNYDELQQQIRYDNDYDTLKLKKRIKN